MSLTFTPVKDIPQVVQNCRDFYATGKTIPVAYRLQQLHRFMKAMNEFEQQLLDAMVADFKKPKTEGKVMEIDLIRNEIWTMISNLRDWTAPQHVHKEGIQKLDTAYTLANPLGTVLIIGAWNYPVQLTLAPLAGAIASGCTVVIKPSELSPNTARVVTELIAKTFDPNYITVVNGAVAENTAVLDQHFDHILYTGSGRVGKIVAAAAAKHLTSVTLELGGKSPAYVDSSANVPVAARRIVWGKFVNCAQTCIAVDYVLAHESVKSQLIDEMKKAIVSFYGEEPKNSPDYARIVNDGHFKRLKGLLDGGKIICGGQTIEKERYIAPTILDDVKLDHPLMTDEIFGPLLPILSVKDHNDAINFINARDKPLALYCFSQNSKIDNEFLHRTAAGGVTVNDVLMHAAVESLPFGGVGPSGTGAYHGKRSFDMFTHHKAVLIKAAGLEFANDIRYPPYSEKKENIIRFLLNKTGPSGRGFMFYTAVGAVLTAALAVYCKYYQKGQKLF